MRTVYKVSAFTVLAAAVLAWAMTTASGNEPAVVLPKATLDPPVAMGANRESVSAVFAGGCFWGVQAVFQHVRGVNRVLSGYAGGKAEDAHYNTVGSGRTGHAEAVEIRFDPKIVSYATLLQVFFSVAHDPTQLNRQGPDVGTQYRSAIFVADAEQRRIAEAYIAQLDDAHAFPKKIVTEVSELKGFYAAEDYHQDYATLHPEQPYILFNDRPKVENFLRLFPAIANAKPVLVDPAHGS
jgi:peptide-methionine (S)-S-oxide reductase